MISRATRRLVRDRAGGRCEYCRLRAEHSPLASLQIEHLIAKKHGGGDEDENLALACIDCNLAKASNLAGLDPLTGRLTPLYHPRQQRWEDHFELRGKWLIGRTDIGRTTIAVLAMNSDEQLELRAYLMEES